MALTQVQPGMLGTPQPYNFKNRLINGAMQVWQRGTSQTLTNGLVYGSVDRWVFIQGGGSASVSLTQSTDVATGFQYSVKQQRTAASTTTGTVYSAQEIESVNCYGLAGQSITFSFWAKCGSNFSASGSALTSLVYQGTGVDQGTTSWISGTWTSPTSNTQSNTLTTSWQKFTQTVAINSTTTELLVSLQWVPVGTAGADDSVYFTGVQLEVGVSATTFDYRAYGLELMLCQRYYEVVDYGSGGAMTTGQAISSSRALANLFWTVVKRAAPTSITYTGVIQVWNAPASSFTPASITFASTSVNSTRIDCQSVATSPLVAGNAAMIYPQNEVYLQVSAEL